MNFDTAHRHQQALDPSALTTIRTTLHAIEQGIIDCRNAGVDPDTDPAVVLLARHLAVVSSNQASQLTLQAACRRRLDDIARFPALLALAIGGVAYDTAAKDRFHKDGRRALRRLACALGLGRDDHSITSWQGDRSLLGKVRPIYGHDEHFHIRIKCPQGAAGCKPQAKVPAGDGCDASLAWWFTKEPWEKPKPKPDAKIVGEELRSVQLGLDTQKKGVSAQKVVVSYIS